MILNTHWIISFFLYHLHLLSSATLVQPVWTFHSPEVCGTLMNKHDGCWVSSKTFRLWRFRWQLEAQTALSACQEYHFHSPNIQWIYHADLVRNEGNFLWFFTKFSCTITLKGKILSEESYEQYPDLESFAISSVPPLEFSSALYTQVISTLSCNPPSYVGVQAPEVFSVVELSFCHLLVSWSKQFGRSGPVLVTSQSIHRDFCISSNDSVVTPVALVRQSRFRLKRNTHQQLHPTCMCI